MDGQRAEEKLQRKQIAVDRMDRGPGEERNDPEYEEQPPRRPRMLRHPSARHADEPYDEGRDEDDIKQRQAPVPEGKLTDEATFGLQKAERKGQPSDQRVGPVSAWNQRLQIPPGRSENIVEIGKE